MCALCFFVTFSFKKLRIINIYDLNSRRACQKWQAYLELVELSRMTQDNYDSF